ncbi:MAG: hypothetical protein JNM56_22400 [Planctomycetia bacterium]|nr:hypothetical protein [Planctomycetia bacterium]
MATNRRQARHPRLGQVTFRLPAALHAELLEVAQRGDDDVSEILRCLIGRYLERYHAEFGAADRTVKDQAVEEAEHQSHRERLARAQARAVTAGKEVPNRVSRLTQMLLTCLGEPTPLTEADLIAVVARAEESLCLERDIGELLRQLIQSGQVERALDKAGEMRFRLTKQTDL